MECESITLSRPVPMLLKPIAWPMVKKVARESLDRTLVRFRERFGAPAMPLPPKATVGFSVSGLPMR